MNQKIFLLVTIATAAIYAVFMLHRYGLNKNNSNNPIVDNRLTLYKLYGMLDFVKIKTGYCDGIMDPFNASNPTSHKGFEIHLQKLKEYDKRVIEARSQKASDNRKNLERIEGYTAMWEAGTLVYWHLVKLPFVKMVCETGFNAGHSSFLWLSTNPQTHVYSFDIGEHKYSQKMAAYLQSQFPGRLNVTWGDSTLTLPEFHRNYPSIKCDLLFIDGGHTISVAQSDFNTFRQMANPVHLVMMDDHPALHVTRSDNGPRTVWEEAKLKGTVHELAVCSRHGEMRGVAFGMYLLE